MNSAVTGPRAERIVQTGVFGAGRLLRDAAKMDVGALSNVAR